MKPFLKNWSGAILFGVVWLDWLNQLSYTWRTNEAYSYGWFVAPIAAYLIWLRFADCPAMDTIAGADHQNRSLKILTLAALGIACLALMPLRVIFEVNANWPLISWAYSLIMIGLALAGLSIVGGWSYVRHFGFPIVFLLTAIEWPYRVENTLKHTLMQTVAEVATEVLGIFGVAAVRHGNLIEVNTGVVGVDEACSGIRSFQSSIMISLALGEMYRAKVSRRLALGLLSIALAYVLNVARVLFLSLKASSEGLSAVDKWHDTAGLTITVGCFLGTWLIALALSRKSDKQQPRSGDSSAVNTSGASGTENVADKMPTKDPIWVLQLPKGFQSYLRLIGIGTFLVVACNEAWYRSHELRTINTTRWWVNFPTNAMNFHSMSVSKAAAKLLQHDKESGASWDEPDGSHWTVYCFRWNEGDTTARMSAQAHRPEYCLVGSGHKMVSMSDIKLFSVQNLQLPFRAYTFGSGERLIHVFFCLWEDGSEVQGGFGITKIGDRLRAALNGRRRMGQQTLEIICSGYTEMAAAEQAVRERLPEIISNELEAGGRNDMAQ